MNKTFTEYVIDNQRNSTKNIKGTMDELFNKFIKKVTDSESLNEQSWAIIVTKMYNGIQANYSNVLAASFIELLINKVFPDIDLDA